MQPWARALPHDRLNSVRDLTAADLPHLFERFWHQNAARTSAARSGLGLSLAKAFVGAMQMPGGGIPADGEKDATGGADFLTAGAPSAGRTPPAAGTVGAETVPERGCDPRREL